MLDFGQEPTDITNFQDMIIIMMIIFASLDLHAFIFFVQVRIARLLLVIMYLTALLFNHVYLIV